MSETTSLVRPTQNWRQTVTVGLSIGIGLAAARIVESSLEGSTGQGFAITAATLAAGMVGGLVALIIASIDKHPVQGRVLSRHGGKFLAARPCMPLDDHEHKWQRLKHENRRTNLFENFRAGCSIHGG